MKDNSKNLTETLISQISQLEQLQKFPYEEVIARLKDVILKQDTPEKTEPPLNLPKIQITFKDKAVFFNGIEVIRAKAKRKAQIFSILFNNFINSYKSGIAAENFSLINVNQIATKLETPDSIIDPERIRWHINQMRKLFRDLFGIEIIESVPWKGLSSDDYGYRLNPLVIVLFMTNEAKVSQ